MGNEIAPLPPLRAFQIFSEIPVGCTVHKEPETRHEPHIHAGEMVVIDANDRSIELGELYLIAMSDGPNIWQVAKIPEKWLILNPHLADCGYLRPLHSATYLPNGEIDWRRPVHMADGPIRLKRLQEYVVGRVIGLYAPN